jgi:hypothetical protein
MSCSRSSKYRKSSLGLELLKVGAVRSLRIGIVYVLAIGAIDARGGGCTRLDRKGMDCEKEF